MAKLRADQTGAHRAAYEKNRKVIMATQDTCGICGGHVDMSLSYLTCPNDGRHRDIHICGTYDDLRECMHALPKYR